MQNNRVTIELDVVNGKEPDLRAEAARHEASLTSFQKEGPNNHPTARFECKDRDSANALIDAIYGKSNQTREKLDTYIVDPNQTHERTKAAAGSSNS